MDADIGLFAQDKWTVHRITLNLGLRYDYFSGSVPAQDIAANRGCRRGTSTQSRCSYLERFFSTTGFCLRRIRTVDRHQGQYEPVRARRSLTVAGANNPVTTSVASANRNWTDPNFNWVPECDFTTLP